MTDHADLTARHIEAVPDDLVDDMHSALGALLNIDGHDDEGVDYLSDIVSTITPLVGRVLDAADAENARLRAALFDVTHAVMQEAEAHRYGQPAYDMTLDHLYEIADHHRSVLAVSEEATDV